jgi:hypothetical protein
MTTNSELLELAENIEKFRFNYIDLGYKAGGANQAFSAKWVFLPFSNRLP